MEKYDDFAKDLRVLEWTEPTPGLPLITAKKNDAEVVFRAVKIAIEELAPADRALLCLRGIVGIPKDKYTAISNPPRTLSTQKEPNSDQTSDDLKT